MDLTKITTPFGLLDAETQKALEDASHAGQPIEFYNECGAWMRVLGPSWVPGQVYRVKPQPPKPREWWINVYIDGLGCLYAGQLHSTRSKADALGNLRLECIRVREVLE